MEAIARAAHVSPKTIYGRYGSKEGIFGASLRARAAAVHASLRAPIASSADVRSVLVDFATRLLTVTTSPEALHMQRLVIAQSVRFPELGREFFEAGPQCGMATLAAFFIRATGAGFMNVIDPPSAAEMFCGALLGVPIRSALIRHTRSSRRTIDRRASDVVALFLAAYGVPSR